jgi:DNA-binding transcriptional LysR family regulator
MFQLLALAFAAESEKWTQVASALGTDKYSASKAVKRLEDRLGGTRIVGGDGDSIVINRTEGAEEILEYASTIRAAYENVMQTAQGLTGGPVRIRCRTYPGYVRNYLGRAIGRFERELARAGGGSAGALVDLRGVDYQYRGGAGTGMLEDLLEDPRTLDVAVAPWSQRVTTVSKRALYKWKLLAMMRTTHPLNDQQHAAVSIGDLAEYDLMVSPVGHRSTRMLLEAAGPAHTLNLVLQTPQTATRVALAAETDRVAIVPSDAVDPEQLERVGWRPIAAGLPGEGELTDRCAIYWPNWDSVREAKTADTLKEALDRFISGFVIDEARAYCARTIGTVVFDDG